MKNIMLVTLATVITGAMSMSAFAVQSNQGHGTVKFIGEIIDAPCSISSDTIDQTVKFDQISNTSLANGGSSRAKTFNITLEDCVFPAETPNDKVKITFSGASAAFNSKLLGVTGLNPADGNVKNVGIQITDTNGLPLDMGVSSSQAIQLQKGQNTLQYSAYVQGADVAIDAIPLGNFEGVTTFTLAYN
ncbi:fimbrial protein [Proteus faecis]|uniref:fimbrial protein n=1 Tax=Proteus faecis TaxID=2050967 RepID=UPI0025797DB7|nr:fimbrial protein [Proteus faecis]MDM3869182.1 fimbrial protein [Proteus faecis]